jgi:hypothetical protein
MLKEIENTPTQMCCGLGDNVDMKIVNAIINSYHDHVVHAEAILLQVKAILNDLCPDQDEE